MVLVSDDEDGEGAVLTMTDPPDFIGPTHDDRETYTHKVELGGTVAITRVEDDSGQSVNISDISLPVPPRQILRAGETTPQPAEVPVAIYILGDVTPDIATVSAKLTAQMQNTRERFAQIGLKVSFIGPITMPMPLQLPSPNGLSHSNLIQQPDGYTQEEKAIINTAAGASGTPLSDGTIAVYVCKSLLHFSQVEVPLNERDILYGYTWQGKAPVGINHPYNIFIDGEQLNDLRYTVAHEIIHVITQRGHYGDRYQLGWGAPTHKINHNLMRNQPDTDDSVGGNKRLFQAQESLIFPRSK